MWLLRNRTFKCNHSCLSVSLFGFFKWDSSCECSLSLKFLFALYEIPSGTFKDLIFKLENTLCVLQLTEYL